MMKNNSERWILYPAVKDKQVVGITAGILKNTEIKLEFWSVDPSDDYYKEIINLFRLAYTKKLVDEATANKGSGCGWNEESPCSTGEVVIHVPKPNGPKGDPNLYLPGQGGGGSDPGVIGGDCGVYGNCGDGGGNNAPSNPEPPEDPCEKTKGIVKNLKSKPAIDDLKTKSTQGGENGYKFKADGTPSNLIAGSAHSVNFGDKTGYAGGYHNHTPKGTPMFSPPDIDQLLGFARAQPTTSNNTGNAFVGMIAPNGMHYVIWFNGTYQDALTNFSQEDLDKYIKIYKDTESNLTDFEINGNTYINSNGKINNLGVETLFFETLKNMGLTGKAILQRIENDGTVKIINLNDSNQPISTTCP